jgi:23S rRNA G2445 N2-methylase RlmL
MATDTSHTIQAQRRYEARSSDRFDRIAYAMALLRLLKPPMTVAVYARNRYLHVEQSRRPDAHEPWATLGVPPHATRESIASAVVQLSGLSHESFLIDLLCAGTLDASD